MRYRALRAGTVGPKGATVRVEVGEEFELPHGVKPGRWMEPLGYAEASGDRAPKRRASPRPKPSDEPRAFSDLTKSEADALPPT